jgi:hypothetical protein
MRLLVYGGPDAHTTTGSALTLVIPLLSLLVVFALAWFMRRRLLAGSGPLIAPMPPAADPMAPDSEIDSTAPSPGETPPQREPPPQPPDR